MSLFQTKPTTALGLVLAAALFLGFAGTASADPGKGLRWSDFAWGSSSRGLPTRPTPSHMYRPAYASPRPPAYARPYGYAPAVIPGQVIVTPYQAGPGRSRSGPVPAGSRWARPGGGARAWLTGPGLVSGG